MNIIRHLQGERRGMGSQFKPPTDKQKVTALFAPSITIPNIVLIPDVSFYQAEIDFVKMKAAGINGVIIRAGQRYWVDPRFAENWKKAKAAGLLRGSYWFYDGREDPKKQAALWYKQIKNDMGELVHVPDLEDNYGGAFANKASRKLFVTEFQSISGLPNKKIVIYTGFYWWNSNIGADSFYRRYRLWLAWYSPEEVVRIPAPWLESDLVLWQYTSSGDGTKYGVSSKEIDLNWYNGTQAQFAAEFGTVSEPPTGEPMTSYGKVNVASLNIRDSRPGGTYKDIGDLKLNDTLEASEIVGGWWRLSKINGVSVTRESWASGQYITLTPPPVEPPPPADTEIITELAAIKEAVMSLIGVHVNIVQTLNTLVATVGSIKTDTTALLNQTPTEPPPPAPTGDGYKGKHKGYYRIAAIAGDFTSFQPLNGDGGYSTPMQDRTVKHMEANCPGWDDFVHPAGNVKPSITFDGTLWQYTSKMVLGQVVRVAEIVNGRARIVGMDADGDPMFAAVNLDACSPDKTRHYFHKITNVPRWYPIIQPRGKDNSGYPQCWWIDMLQVTLEPL